MKKILYSLFAITLILTLATSCKDSDPVVNDKGKISSATYHATYKTFTVTYSNGETETVNAIIDERTTPSSASATLNDGTTIYVTDANQSGKATIGEVKNGINTVSQFVYDGMSKLYFWNYDVTGKKPTLEDKDPKKYFERLLSSVDKKHNWSWITDDAKALFADFAGEPMTFGYDLDFILVNEIIYGRIKYVYKDTPAYNAGIRRLDLIGEINGERITADEKGYISNKDVDLLYGNKPVTFSIYRSTDKGIEKTKDNVHVTPKVTQTDPVVFDSIYTIGDKTIGYLFYTSFISNFNYRLHEVFLNFKQKGVTDLILDLRYNLGGDITAATYLASIIAPKSNVEQKDIFTILSYNKSIGQNNYKLGEYVEKDIIKNGKVITKAEPNPLDANLNLNNISIIATSSSYSASELITFCLRQQMQKVTHIGSKTGGKYTASITIHAYDDKSGSAFPLYPELLPKKSIDAKAKSALENWALQPIVAIYTDKLGNDFIETNGLIPDSEIYEGFGYFDYWKSLGDTDDTLLGESIYLITDNEDYKPIAPKSRNSRTATYNLINPKRKLRQESVLINNFNHLN